MVAIQLAKPYNGKANLKVVNSLNQAIIDKSVEVTNGNFSIDLTHSGVGSFIVIMSTEDDYQVVLVQKY